MALVTLPIRAVVFDLDGTLVQTERLKARSYAQAAIELCPRGVSEAEVIEAFKEVVGLPRQQVAEHLIARFELEPAARARMAEFDVATPWEAFVGVRFGYYQRLIDDPDTLRRHRWPRALELLESARAEGCRTALATMSHRPQVEQVLTALLLQESFDVIATRDDVHAGKPDPEIYRWVSDRLGIPTSQSLIIEDSVAGIRAAQAAGAEAVGVATPFTRDALHASGLLDPDHLVDDHDRLLATVNAIFETRNTPQENV